MIELSRIAFVPASNQQYIDSLHSYYKSMGETAVPELAEKKPQRKENGSYVIPWDQASQIMLRELSVKKRLEYGQ